MEMDLKNIIDKIKQEGVDEAEQKAAGIVQEAEDKARAVLEDAKKQKAGIIKKAEQDAKKLENNGKEAVKQASRDVLLSLRESIVELFDKVVKKEVTEQLSSDAVKEMIVKLAEKFDREKQTDIEVLLSDKDKKDLEKAIFAALGKEIQKGLTIKTSSSIEHGFRIGEKDKHSYYDFTDEAVSEAFMAHLNPKVVEILTKDKENEQ